ncbi:MAG: RnfABCDGE type electron transport complex subunit B [Candidatus Saganbacteria bacterium]|nr:RnfABCDGE type electron transport complex subunit B [Candidatus Saganbacteria bacterium]
MNIILISILTMGGLGLFFAAILAIAFEKLKVEENPMVEKVLNALPGLNCGACGYTGCHDFAEKIVAQGSLDNLRCPPGGSAVVEDLSEILGISADEPIKRRAVVKCGGSTSLARDRAEYAGIQTCVAAELVGGGPKACTYGCLGFGDCAKACPFDALYIGKDGLAHVVFEKCTACGLCVTACPRKIIELIPCSNQIIVNCSSTDRCSLVREVCKVGCIGCKICERTAPGVYVVEDTLARVVFEKGDAAAEPAIVKCPTKCIVKL